MILLNPQETVFTLEFMDESMHLEKQRQEQQIIQEDFSFADEKIAADPL